MTQFLGVYREPICSPGRHRENDAMILELVAAALEQSGYRVALVPGEAAARFANDGSLVFSMSRSPVVLELLSQWVSEGRTVINHPAAVLATARSRLAGRKPGAVDFPRSHVVPTARAMRERVRQSLPHEDWWVKGGDLYASRREDVHRVHTMEALEYVLDDFDRRGVSTAVVQEHVPGREVKFYAVGAAAFFHWLDSAAQSSAGATVHTFRPPATASGLALDLEIFGGDLVIGDDGRVTLIDLNDWPSFAPCRDPAARAIAQYLEARFAAAYAPVGSVIPSASA
jgi:hypothetical protein